MTAINWDYGLEPPDEPRECPCECHEPATKPGDIKWIDGHCFECEEGDDDVEDPALD